MFCTRVLHCYFGVSAKRKGSSALDAFFRPGPVLPRSAFFLHRFGVVMQHSQLRQRLRDREQKARDRKQKQKTKTKNKKQKTKKQNKKTKYKIQIQRSRGQETKNKKKKNLKNNNTRNRVQTTEMRVIRPVSRSVGSVRLLPVCIALFFF